MLKGYHILVAEDNALNQKIVTILLQKQGASVTTVSNGIEAIAELERDHYNLVLMDLQMPQMDGFETTLHIRKVLKSNILIIALSASTFDQDRDRCIEVGMNDCISKPVDTKKLCEIILDFTGEKKITSRKADL